MDNLSTPTSVRNKLRGAPVYCLDVALLGVIILVFCLLEFTNLDHPGLYGDEAWGAIPAARMAWGEPNIDDAPFRQFHLLGHVFPYMANLYTGPIKTYILAASFSLFGVSVGVLRVTMGTVGLVGIIGLFLFVRVEFSRLAAFFSAMLLTTDLSYLLTVRGDWPPFAFAAVARTFALFFLISWWRRGGDLRILFAGMLVLGLGLTHKADFLSSVVAITVAGALLSYRQVSIGWKQIAVALSGFIAGAWPILVFNIITQGATFREGNAIANSFGRRFLPTSIPEIPQFVVQQFASISDRLELLRQLLAGSFIANWQLSWKIEPYQIFGMPLIVWAFAIAVPLLGVLACVEDDYRRSWRVIAFMLAVLLIIFALTVATPIAVGPHHMMSVYPLPHAIIGIAFAGLWSLMPNSGYLKRNACRALATIPIGAIVVLNSVLIFHYYDHLLAKGATGFWSESIFELPKLLRERGKNQNVVILDWSLEHPLIILERDRLKLEVPMWQLAASGADEHFYNLLRGDNLYLIRPADFSVDPKIAQRFRDAYTSIGLKAKEIKVLQKDGRESYSLVELVPQ